ncbi:nuclear transport factor 2 family protein [Sulfitobacter mediterraneus]|uniref:ester cyclase n=1 Tax=Sulfitobacter mediterraneus TaxID=83219 RepID=UPI001931F491|nr:ester cyclase [Sulfitobacter mediterraneus]MBM1310747.1 nuclear transport factor 2 family protein [Sulfitobacter mediterraneus]MBM1314631.1 nuclear transport factor 2 family protein [Sulfitobacter mediterraneus]MBM1322991.1 nuclear transport factor 2 family protein [Sulfitobacter mediterraneus]MBM1326903.1 nuclear transport factor 2 family protein [Sulfitobacter mediterraneus]MBM1398249.1 nuclear transport factor 2 family protein [Sulfitobacter mediterraneus]
MQKTEPQAYNVLTFKEEKRLVRAHHAALISADPAKIGESMQRDVAEDYLWRGFHPFGLINGAETVASRFWAPLRTALTRMQRREDIFFAGTNEMDGFKGVWVVSMGHLVGLFDQPWLGIKPTNKMAFLRYCSFDRVENGKITETAMYFDIPHLMTQAGQCPFPTQTAFHLVQPGPMTHDGLLLDYQPAETGTATLAAINAMISDLGQWKSGLTLEDELARTWHDDMIWWGPEGIGATYTIERYAKQHAGPFRAGFTDRAKTKHIARLAEGHYGGFFGWPNFTARPTGGFMGLPGSETSGEFRVIDIYRRDGDKLAENWIFIDLLHFWKTQGRDFLAEATGQST